MRVTARLILAVVFVTLAGCSSLSRLDPPGEPRPVWEPIDGPYGGPINDLALGTTGTLFAATQQGLFRRQPQHDAWTHASDTVAKTETVKSLLTGPNGMLYARTAFHLLRSRDRGERWQSLDAALKRDTGARPTDLTTLQSGGNGAVFLGTRRQGLLRSVDVGESWQRVLGGTPPPRVDVGPVAAAGGLYVAASARGEYFNRLPRLYRSENGTDWQRLPDPPVPIRHFAPGSDGHLVAAGWRWLDQGRRMALYASTDGGQSWTRGKLPVERLVALARSPNGSLYALGENAIYRQDTAGVWHQLTIRGLGFQGLRGSLQALAWDAHQLYLATDLGVWRSNDGGQSWESFQRAPRASAVSRFAAAGERLYALAARRLYKASNDAQNWHPMPQATAVRHLATRPDGMLFAATADNLYTYSANTEWQRRQLPEGGMSGLAAASNGSAMIYGKRRLWRLTDDGIAPIDAPVFTSDLIFKMQAGSDGLVLADRVERGMARSLDNGRTWQAVPDTAFGEAGPPDGVDFFHFAVNEAIYAIDGPRLYRSTNRGTSWRRLPAIEIGHPPEKKGQGPHARAITSLATTSNGNLFAATRRGGVYRWRQARRTWRAILSGLPTGEIEALTVTPRGHLLAATPQGVFRMNRSARSFDQPRSNDRRTVPR